MAVVEFVVRGVRLRELLSGTENYWYITGSHLSAGQPKCAGRAARGYNTDSLFRLLTIGCEVLYLFLVALEQKADVPVEMDRSDISNEMARLTLQMHIVHQLLEELDGGVVFPKAADVFRDI